MSAVLAGLAALSLFGPPMGAPLRLGPEPPPLPPGGYYGVGEFPETPPPDGERSILTGSIVFPLGVLRLATGLAQFELASPRRCTYSASTCEGLQIFGLSGVSTGALMIVTGTVFLGIGLSRRSTHRRWKAARNLASGNWRLRPRAVPRGAGVSFDLRF